MRCSRPQSTVCGSDSGALCSARRKNRPKDSGCVRGVVAGPESLDLPRLHGYVYKLLPQPQTPTRPRMAGHSQFKNIMHRKGRQDAARSKLFSKLAREITVAAKLGVPDPGMNPRLRAAILAARAENMPKDNIERAIKKAQGGDADTYEEIRYEGYGPGGVAVIVEVLTDNRNRAAGEVRA